MTSSRSQPTNNRQPCEGVSQRKHQLVEFDAKCYNYMMKIGKLLCSAVLVGMGAFTPPARGEGPTDVPLTVFSMNLHGYHPTGEGERFREDRQGRTRPAESNLHYFTYEELDRGNRRRLDRLADDLGKAAPDIILLQEVAAGSPGGPKNADLFYRQSSDDNFDTNTAVRLMNRLNRSGKTYAASLAFRGNVAWQTYHDTYSHERVVKFEDGKKKVVHEFDSNPYPQGLFAEGFAVLAREPWKVMDKQEMNVTTNYKGDRVFVQVVALKREQPTAPGGKPAEESPWVVVANIHGGHKVGHFEQAVAVRSAIADYVKRFPSPNTFGGVILGGDFNAELYRPAEKKGEVSTVPWEVRVPGQFDFSDISSKEALIKALHELNNDQRYKPWATIRDGREADRRIRDSVDRFFELQKNPVESHLRDTMLTGERRPPAASPGLPLSAATEMKERIDFILSEPQQLVEESGVAYASNDWRSVDGLSDHPAILTRLRLFPRSTVKDCKEALRAIEKPLPGK